MHRNAERIQAVLRERGFEARVVEFAESTRTSADAAAAIGTTVAQIGKSLLFLAGEEPVLVIASGAGRVSLSKLEQLLGAPIQRADGDTVKRVTGFPIGGVPPVGHDTPLRVLIDQDLLPFATIWSAAGTPHAVFEITPAALVQATGGLVADVREER